MSCDGGREEVGRSPWDKSYPGTLGKVFTLVLDRLTLGAPSADARLSVDLKVWGESHQALDWVTLLLVGLKPAEQTGVSWRMFGNHPVGCRRRVGALPQLSQLNSGFVFAYPSFFFLIHSFKKMLSVCRYVCEGMYVHIYGSIYIIHT